MWKRPNNLNFQKSYRIGIGICVVLSASLAAARPSSDFVSVTATFQEQAPKDPAVSSDHPKQPKPLKSYKKDQWVRVGGFTDSKYIYGQVKILGNRKIAGYLYPPKKEQIYIYGKITSSGTLQAFDNKGTLYRLLVVE